MESEAIIFDKDGTLFDFEATWSGAMLEVLEAVSSSGGQEKAAEAIGFDLETRRFRPGSVAIAGTAMDTGQVLAPVVGCEVAEVVRIMDEIAARTVPVPVVDLVPCLERLRSVGPMGVVTNDSEVPARAHLEGAGIAGLFDFVAGFDSGHGNALRGCFDGGGWCRGTGTVRRGGSARHRAFGGVDQGVNIG